MNKVKILSEKDIKSLINLKMTIKAVEAAYMQKSNKQAEVWPLVFYEYEHDIFDLDIRSGNLLGSGAYGLKLISYNENNPKNGYPKVYGTAIICDDKTGKPLALLNAAPITFYRTGAAAAIGAKYLAKKDSKILLVVGNGNIAKYSTAATLYLLPTIEKVYVYNPKRTLNDEELLSFKNDVSNLLGKTLNTSFNKVDDIEKITGMSDIIITSTPSYEAIIKDEWVKNGTHLSCMGACIKNQQEIDENIWLRAKAFADDENQCLTHGEAQTAYNKKIISKFSGEIGNIILGNLQGRTTEDDITIFDSTGLFLQDLATSMELIKEANEKNIGIDVDL